MVALPPAVLRARVGADGRVPSSYTASAQLCPLKYRPIVGWIVGWLNILGTLHRHMLCAAHDRD